MTEQHAARGAISLSGVRKTFKVPHEKRNNVKEHLLGAIRARSYETFTAVDGVSFEVAPGEFVGIVGANGAGKSTVLKLVSGVLAPDAGRIIVGGRIAPFLELGVGFHPELSGRDNIYLYAAILGLVRKEVRDRYGAIVSFSGLERFIDLKLKNYSSGMLVRLGFAITAYVDADIVLVDEVLAVGDHAFQEKCYETMRRFRKQGKTVLLVSHDLKQVRDVCERALWLRSGRIQSFGESRKVADAYRSSL